MRLNSSIYLVFVAGAVSLGCSPSKATRGVSASPVAIDQGTTFSIASWLPELLPEIRRRLASPTEGRRDILVAALGMCGTRSGFEIAGGLLDDPDPKVVREAELLLSRGLGKAPDSLVSSVTKSGRVRALEQLAFYDAVPKLFPEIRACLLSKDPEEIRAALRLVAVWRIPGCEKEIYAIMRSNPSDDVYSAGIRSLAALWPKHPWVRESLAILLAFQNSPKQHGRLPDNIDFWRRVDHPLLRDAAKQWLLSADLATRDAAIEYFESISYSPPEFERIALTFEGPERFIADRVLEIAQRTHEPWVFSVASELLDTSRSYQASLILARSKKGKALLRSRLGKGTQDQNLYAALALVAEGESDPAVMDTLKVIIEQTESQDAKVRKEAVKKIAWAIQAPWAHDLMQKALKDPDADIRILAIQALREEL